MKLLQKQLYICRDEYKGKFLYLLTNSQSKMTISMSIFLKKKSRPKVEVLMIVGKASPRTVQPKRALPKLEGKYTV